MKIGITLKPHAYIPEAFAYQKYLEAKGWQVQLAEDCALDPNNDVNIYFMGTRPFWKKKQGCAKEIHEYQSLSVPCCPRLKDGIKKIINGKPDGRIFLNQYVQRALNFRDHIPSIQRDMGIDETLFQTPDLNPLYDVVYAGSVTGRVGLIQTILKLAHKGFKILLVGELSSDDLCQVKHPNITLTGRVSRDELPKLYRQCRAGLNYTPDIYPFNMQTSTKTLEYLASGLNVISNKYEWIVQFCNHHDYQPIWLSDELCTDELDQKIGNLPNMHEYSWDMILQSSNFEYFLQNMLSGG